MDIRRDYIKLIAAAITVEGIIIFVNFITGFDIKVLVLTLALSPIVFISALYYFVIIKGRQKGKVNGGRVNNDTK